MTQDTKSYREEYDPDRKFDYWVALAPVWWLTAVATCMLMMLDFSGYLPIPESPEWRTKVLDAINVPSDMVSRGALAYSGATLAIFLVLSGTCLFWTVNAFRKRAREYRRRTLYRVAIFLSLGYFLLGSVVVLTHQKFTSEFGDILLYSPTLKLSTTATRCVPNFMLGIACAVPALLAAGACILMQPMKTFRNGKDAARQLLILAGRLNELDQLLYVGALALVFGTLQLSAAMSVPLAGIPRAVDLKIVLDLCKMPTSEKNPFLDPSDVKVVTGTSFYEPFDTVRCRRLPKDFARSEVADGLRQFIRAVTISFGLIFSAMLAAIYVPALIGLRFLIDPRQQKAAEEASTAKETASAIGDIDPLRRVATIAATLSPLIAGLLANAFAVS
jgi:hypothetical protein